MKKHLYLDKDSLGFLAKSKEQTGDRQGGKHAARVQTGFEKDGSPQYRYFDTMAEYQSYLADEKKGGKDGKDGKGGKSSPSKKSSKKNSGKGGGMKDKLEKEQRKSSKYTKTNPSDKVSQQHSKNRSLYAGHTASVKKFKKSSGLYLGEK